MDVPTGRSSRTHLEEVPGVVPCEFPQLHPEERKAGEFTGSEPDGLLRVVHLGERNLRYTSHYR